MHPLYHKPIGMSHDIALLKLDRPVKVTRWVHYLLLMSLKEAQGEKNLFVLFQGVRLREQFHLKTFLLQKLLETEMAA